MKTKAKNQKVERILTQWPKESRQILQNPPKEKEKRKEGREDTPPPTLENNTQQTSAGGEAVPSVSRVERILISSERKKQTKHTLPRQLKRHSLSPKKTPLPRRKTTHNKTGEARRLLFSRVERLFISLRKKIRRRDRVLPPGNNRSVSSPPRAPTLSSTGNNTQQTVGEEGI